MDEYTVNIGGVDHTILLDADEAKRQGLAKNVKAVQPASNKAAMKPRDKSI